MPKSSAERQAPSIRTAATSFTMFVTRVGLSSVESWPWLTLFDVLVALPADWHRYIFPGSFGESLTMQFSLLPRLKNYVSYDSSTLAIESHMS